MTEMYQKQVGESSKLLPRGEQSVEVQPVSSDHVLQGHAFQILHGDEQPVSALPNLVNGANIGMVEGGSGASFSAETLQCLRVTRQIVGQELQSNKAAKVGVLSLVDDTHSAATELFDDAVVRNGLADHWQTNVTSVKRASQRMRGYSYLVFDCARLTTIPRK